MKTNMVCHNEQFGLTNLYIYSLRETEPGIWSVVGKWGNTERLENTDIKSQVKSSHRCRAHAYIEMQRLFRARCTTRDYVDITSPGYNGSLTMNTPVVKDNLEGPDVNVPDREPVEIEISAGHRYEVCRADGSTEFLTGPLSLSIEHGATVNQLFCSCGSGKWDSAVDMENKPVLSCSGCGKFWSLRGKRINDEDAGVCTCIDNKGMEDRFDTGIEYVFEPHDDSEMLYVFDRFGERRECFASRFQVKSGFRVV